MRTISKPIDVTAGEFAKLLHDDRWVLQQKIDGVRVIVRCNGATGIMTAETRTGLPLSPRELKFWNRIKDQFATDTDYTFDGELAWGHYYPFDELTCPEQPYEDRIARVHELVDRWNQPNIRKVPEARGADKPALWSRILDQRIEGAVLWNLDHPWMYGTDLNVCVKHKVLHRCDVVLMEMNRKRSARAFVYDRDGQPLFIGSIPLLSRKNYLAVDEQIRLRKLVVAEVEYRHRSHNGSLVEPKLIRFRDDKTPAQCTVDQPFHEAHAGEMDGGPSVSAVGSAQGIVGHDDPAMAKPNSGVERWPDTTPNWVTNTDWVLVLSIISIAVCAIFNLIMKLGGMNPPKRFNYRLQSSGSRRFGNDDED